ncbi:ATP-binding protein [Tardiphaga sp. 866_E4_N2_1]|uniref:ATP-binding protein n=1 Tax=unclassified Tardiphaga TaxID=2631404 RepID=UPI003F254345
MVGRDAAIETSAQDLRTKRFVTIVGPGGIGKTTVAIAIGHRLLPDFDGSVYLIDLGPLNDPRLVASAIASTLGLAVQSEDAMSSVIAYLRDRRILLILDSCEHVVETAAMLAEQIYREAPQCYLLATSREALRVAGEHTRPLMPLDSPPEGVPITADEALRFSATQLFVERVAASGHPFGFSDRDVPAVVEICRRLDGIALAIELAASRVSTYGLEETAAGLNSRFKLLWEGRRTALARHQTLGAALDWSYDLLNTDEQIVLQRLSIFVGIFPLEAAQSVVSRDNEDGQSLVETLSGLVSKSLVAADVSGLTTHYRLLDTTRSYALAKLNDSGDADEMACRHARFFRGLLEHASRRALASPNEQAMTQCGAYISNVRSALKWCFSDTGDTNIGVGLAAAASALFLELSLLTECSDWTERAIAHLEDSKLNTQLELQLQSALGLSLMFTKGNGERTQEALERGLVLAGRLGDTQNELRLLGRLHIFHERVGEFRTALKYAQRSETVASIIGEPIGIAEAHSALGISYHLEGTNAAARFHLEAATAKPSGVASEDTFRFGFDYRNRARIALARVLWLEGTSSQALAMARDTVEEAEALHHPVTLCIALIWAVSLSIWNGDFETGEQYIDRFIALADRHSLAPYQAAGRGVKGELLVRRGEPLPGVAQLREALKALHTLRYELLTASFMLCEAEGLATLGQNDEANQVIDEAIAVTERNGDLFMMPELMRVKGSILLSLQGKRTDDAAAWFRRAYDLAGSHGSTAWQLRAATGLANLEARRGRISEARKLLEPICNRLSREIENADLKSARDLLGRLI